MSRIFQEYEFSAFSLQLKYVMAVRLDLTRQLLTRVYSRLFDGLKDAADDVAAVAAAALQPVVHAVLDEDGRGGGVDAASLIDRLWSALDGVDDITGSTQSMLQLLAEILRQQADRGGVTNGQTVATAASSLPSRVPRLIPFLSHPSTAVRRAALRTLETLTLSPDLAGFFLPCIVKPLTAHLFQRALVEDAEECLPLIERVWFAVCDHTPLGPLLMGTCPQYGSWVTLISTWPHWPLPVHLLVSYAGGTVTPPAAAAGENGVQSSSISQHQYLGGAAAAQSTDPRERERRATKARHLAAKLLGKLAGFIVQRVPGMDYSRDAMPPMDMFVTKILQPSLLTQSAYRRTAICLLITEWCDLHGTPTNVPDILGASLYRFLTEPVNYEESIAAFTQLQTDVGDFIATMKHYKLKLPSEEIGQACYKLNFEQIRTFLTATDFRAALSSNPKLKAKTAESILERLETQLRPAAKQLLYDQDALSVACLAAIAGAVVSLGVITTDKLNPVIRPLMDAVKRERSELLQNLAARNLAKVLRVCIQKQPGQTGPVDKVIKNLVNFVAADPKATPTFVASTTDRANGRILTLQARETDQQMQQGRRRPVQVVPPSVRRNSSVLNGAASELASSESVAALVAVPSSSSSTSSDTREVDERVRVQSGGARVALETIIRHFHRDVFTSLPKLHELTVGAVQAVGTPSMKPPAEMLLCLRALEVAAPALPQGLQTGSLLDCLPHLIALLRSDYAAVRHLAARCVAAVAQPLPRRVLPAVVQDVLPLFSSAQGAARQGAVECVACVVDRVADIDVIPYIVLLVVPVLGLMSDEVSRATLIRGPKEENPAAFHASLGLS
jgi:TATA-binding protein-associated factor